MPLYTEEVCLEKTNFLTNLCSAAKAFAENYKRPFSPQYLLAHALDGVIWGKAQAESFELSPAPSPPLRLETLLQLRLFSEEAEYFLWQDEDTQTWYHRLIWEDEKTEVEKENYLLYGNEGIQAGTFLKLQEGQGFVHFWPGEAQPNFTTSFPALKIIHTITPYPEPYRIQYSRLAGLSLIDAHKIP